VENLFGNPFYFVCKVFLAACEYRTPNVHCDLTDVMETDRPTEREWGGGGSRREIAWRRAVKTMLHRISAYTCNIMSQ